MCEIGKKMYLKRKELGLTLEDVGRAVGVGRSTVRKWENGMIKNMGRDKIAAVAKVLQMSPVEFVPMPDAGNKNMMEVSQTERAIIIAYRKAKPGTQEAVRDVLHVEEEKTPVQESLMG